jgi:hypothetical protein
VRSLAQLFDGLLDGLQVFAFLRLLESGLLLLDLLLLVVGDLVAVLLEVLVDLVDELIGLVALLDQLATRLSSPACASASLRIFSTSSSLRPESVWMTIFCSVPVRDPSPTRAGCRSRRC